MINPLRALRQIRKSARIVRAVEAMQINQGIMLAQLNRQRQSSKLSDYEFKVFSQWGEDGIIQHLIANVDVDAETFVEFGVEDFSESNCRFLMMNNYWSGYVIDGSEEFAERIRNSYYHWRYQLSVQCSFVDRDNISALIAQSGFEKIGILSVDIDGVDWFVLGALAHLRPSIIIVEYNGLFGSVAPVSVPYDPAFVRSRAHASNLYYGASIGAFVHLLNGWDYALVGGNLAGSNAFFVRRDLLNGRIREVGVGEAYRPTAFREARDEKGGLLFPRTADRRALVGHLPLVNVVTGDCLTIAELPDER